LQRSGVASPSEPPPISAAERLDITMASKPNGGQDRQATLTAQPAQRQKDDVQKIRPFLWFDYGQAEEAANFYVSIFKNSKIGNISRYGEDSPGPAGSAMVVTFQLEGQDFLAINGGPHFKLTPAI